MEPARIEYVWYTCNQMGNVYKMGREMCQFTLWATSAVAMFIFPPLIFVYATYFAYIFIHEAYTSYRLSDERIESAYAARRAAELAAMDAELAAMAVPIQRQLLTRRECAKIDATRTSSAKSNSNPDRSHHR